MARPARRELSPIHRFQCGLAVVPAVTAAMLAHGQSAQMIRMEDDGAGGAPQIMHISMPDFGELRQPEFTQRDVPAFTEKLVLSEAQTNVIEALIAAYLDAFKNLVSEALPKPPDGPMAIKLGMDGEDGELGGDGEQGAFVLDMGEAMPAIGEVMLDDPEMAELQGRMPRSMAVGVELRMTAPGPDGEPSPVPDDGNVQPGVSISFESPDGEVIPEEVRTKLEEAAARIAEKMKAQVEQRLAAAGGADPNEALPFGGATSIEELQQRQEEMASQIEEFRKQRATLRQKFVADAQANLIPEQIERWPALERTLLRNKSIPKGRLAGERVDLMKVLAGVEMSESEKSALASPVEAYEVAMDGALKRRDQFLATAHRNIDRAMQDNDPDKALSIIDKATDLRLAVRSINRQFAQALAAQMPEPIASAFNDRLLKSTYPMVYQTTRGQKTFEAALRIEDVSGETRSSIESLQQFYARELADVNAQIRQAVDKHEPLEPRLAMEHTRDVMSGAPPSAFIGGEDNPVREAFARRRALDDRYCKLVADFLTPEQAATLPKAPQKNASGPVIITLPMEVGAQ
jgi:hypothetical protein